MNPNDPTPKRAARPAGGRASLLGLLRATAGALSRLARPLGVVLALAWYALIFRLSSNQGTGLPSPLGGTWILNTGHAFLFGMQALWLLLAFPRDGAFPRVRAAGAGFVLGLVLALGALDELHQSTVPGRSTSVTDLITDLTGAACVLWVVAYAARETASERGLRGRFALCLAACCAAGALATYADSAYP